MAKLTRKSVGSLYKSKDPTKPNYIKINSKDPITLQPGQIIRAESQKFQLSSLEDAISQGKLSGEIAEKIRDRVNKIPEFVIAELVILEEVKS